MLRVRRGRLWRDAAPGLRALVRVAGRPGAGRRLAHGAARRRLSRDPALPALRHRRRRQPHARLRRAHAPPGRGVRGDRAAARRRRSGRGSAWATAGATLVVAVAFRPLRARVQDAVDRRFNRARYDALRRMAELPRRPPRRTAPRPRRSRASCGSCSADPRLELRFLLPESELLRRRTAACRSATRRRRRPRDGRRSSATGSRSASVAARPGAPGAIRALLRELVEAGGLAIEIARLRVRAAPPARRGRGLARADRRRRRRRAPPDRARPARRRPAAARLDRARAAPRAAPARPVGRRARERDARRRGRGDRGRDRRAARARARPAARPARRRARARRCASWPAARRCRSRSTRPGERFDRGLEAAAYFIACEGLTNAVKHAQRHADRAQRRPRRTAGSSSPSPTTASAAPRRSPAPA